LIANKHPQTLPGDNNGQGGGQSNGGTDVDKPTKPDKPTPPTKPTEPGKPTAPTNSTATVKPTKPATTVDASKPATTTSAHKKSTPAVVTAVKGMALYRKPDFTKSGRIVAYRQQAQMHQPQFKVLGTTESKAGHFRYHVRDMNKQSKSYGKTGYITASAKYVQSAEYTKTAKTITVINAKGLNAYSNGKLAGKTKHHYRQGQVLKVKRIVRQNGKYSFQLTNKQYVSANKQDVQTGKHTKPKTVTVKKSINLYRDVNFKHKLHSVSAKTVLKVAGWDYSSKGVLHYRVAGGYITASHALVK